MPVPPGAAVVVMDTGARRSLAGSAYNDRRAACERVVAEIAKATPGVRALRDVTRGRARGGEAAPRRHRLQAREPRRPREQAAGRGRGRPAAGDLARAGRLMNDSHFSLRDLYEVSCEELDLVTEIARRQPSCFGARMTGAGFGGCAVALVKADDVVRLLRRRALGLQGEGRPARGALPLPPGGRGAAAGLRPGPARWPVPENRREPTAVDSRHRLSARPDWASREAWRCSMVSIPELWLPILVATVLVFVASNLVWMVLPHHKSDARRLPDEAAALGRAGQAGPEAGPLPLPVGQLDGRDEGPGLRREAEQGTGGAADGDPERPVQHGSVARPVDRLPGRGRHLRRLRHGPRARRPAPTTSRSSASRAPWPSWPTRGAQLPARHLVGQAAGRRAVKEILDGLLYGLLTAGAFGWLWPR